MTNHVVTYYEPVEGLWSDSSQRALIAVWERSWRKAGWIPVVLTEADVRTHPRFDFFAEHIYSKPSEYGTQYRNAVFFRWLAAAHFGALRGINLMLSDYDNINFGFEPQDPKPNQMTIFCDQPPAGVFMGAVLGTPRHFEDMMELFVAATPGDHDYNHAAKMMHQDDLSLLKRMFETKTLAKPDWLVIEGGSALFDYLSWRTSKMVHFAYAMKQAGYWPKHEWIEKLRPF